MGRRGYVPLRRLDNVPLRRRWVFLNAGWVLILRRQSKQDRRAAKAIQRLTILQGLELQN